MVPPCVACIWSRARREYTLPLGSIIGGLSGSMMAPEMRQTMDECVWCPYGNDLAKIPICGLHTGQFSDFVSN